MSIDGAHGAVFARRDEAEALEVAGNTLRLLADSSATDGAFSVVSTRLRPGGIGASPHHHTKSSELFYVVAGRVDILAGDQVVQAGPGDLAIAPAGLTHAFAPAGEEPAEMLIVLGPGVERFGYFRLLKQVTEQQATFADVLAKQELYDNRFEQSAAWDAHRAAQPRR